VPTSSLVIEPGRAVFALYLDVVCLDEDGGVLDAAVLACVGALRKLRLPKAVYDPDTGETLCETRNAQAASTSDDPPCATTFGLFNGRVLPDPTAFERELCSMLVTVTVRVRTGRLIGISKVGGASRSVDRELLRQCMRIARSRASDVLRILEWKES